MLSIKHEILEALIRIKKHGNQDGKDNTVYYGICDHAKASLPEGSETAKLCYSYLGVLFSDWPHHSGDEWYPVEGEDEFETAMDSRTLCVITSYSIHYTKLYD